MICKNLLRKNKIYDQIQKKKKDPSSLKPQLDYN